MPYTDWTSLAHTTQDYIPVANVVGAMASADLSDTSNVANGDALVGVKQPLTGAVARTQHQKNQEIISVKDFGAVGDGLTDDTTSVQAAINGAGNNSRIDFPQGTYLINSTGLSISSKTGLELFGNGAIIKLSAAGTTVIGSLNVASIVFSSCTDCGIRNIEINGNSKASAAIGFASCTGCFVDSCKIHACGINGQVIAAGGTRNRFINNYVYSAIGSSRGMWLGNNNATDMENEIYISSNVVISNPATGIVCNSIGGRVENNHSCSNGGSGIIFPGASGYAAKKIACVGNYCCSNSYSGIQWDVPSYSTDADLPCDITCSGNICNSNSTSGIFAVNSIRAVLVGNICCDNVTAGIQADERSKQITIVGNQCSDTRAAGQTQQRGIRVIVQVAANSGLTICGNTCNNNTTIGIGLQSSASGIALTDAILIGNVCMNNAGWGIFMSEVTTGDLANISCSNNVCYGNTTSDIRLSIKDVYISGNKYSTHVAADSFDLDSNSATPGIQGRTFWRANNSSPTTITAFNNGVDGQTISILASNGNTTIANGGSIVTKGAINVTLAANEYITFQKYNTVWREISRSF